MQIQITSNQTLINQNITRLDVVTTKDEKPIGSISALLFCNGSRVFESLSALSDSADMNTLLLEGESLEAFESDGYDIKGKYFLSLESIMVVTHQFGTPDYAMVRYLSKIYDIGVMSYVPKDENDVAAERLRNFGFENFGDTGILVFDPQKIDYQEVMAAYEN